MHGLTKQLVWLLQVVCSVCVQSDNGCKSGAESSILIGSFFFFFFVKCHQSVGKQSGFILLAQKAATICNRFQVWSQQWLTMAGFSSVATSGLLVWTSSASASVCLRSRQESQGLVLWSKCCPIIFFKQRIPFVRGNLMLPPPALQYSVSLQSQHLN